MFLAKCVTSFQIADAASSVFVPWHPHKRRPTLTCPGLALRSLLGACWPMLCDDTRVRADRLRHLGYKMIHDCMLMSYAQLTALVKHHARAGRQGWHIRCCCPAATYVFVHRSNSRVLAAYKDQMLRVQGCLRSCETIPRGVRRETPGIRASDGYL